MPIQIRNKSIKKESERLTLLPSGHGDLDGVTSLKPELVWSHDWRASVWMELGACARKCDPTVDLGCLPSLCMSTQSPDAGGTSCRETKLTSPKGGGASRDLNTDLQGPLATLCSLGWDSYLQPSVLRVTPPTDDSILCRVVSTNWDVSWGPWVRGKENRLKHSTFHSGSNQ